MLMPWLSFSNTWPIVCVYSTSCQTLKTRHWTDCMTSSATWTISVPSRLHLSSWS